MTPIYIQDSRPYWSCAISHNLSTGRNQARPPSCARLWRDKSFSPRISLFPRRPRRRSPVPHRLRPRPMPPTLPWPPRNPRSGPLASAAATTVHRPICHLSGPGLAAALRSTVGEHSQSERRHIRPRPIEGDRRRRHAPGLCPATHLAGQRKGRSTRGAGRRRPGAGGAAACGRSEG
jgi:hypothetical protein